MLYKQAFSIRNLCLVIMLTSINLASNYAMIAIPNVKIMDLVVFVSGYMLGLLPGVIVGVLTWLVYGTINPYGFNIIILGATSSCETIYAVAGWLSARLGLGSNITTLNKADWKIVLPVNLKFGIIGFLATSVYDLFTNIASAAIVELPPIMAIISGIPFMIAHTSSNFFFFFFGCVPLLAVTKKLIFRGGEKI